MSSVRVVRTLLTALLPATLLVPLSTSAAQAAVTHVEVSSLQAAASRNGWGPVERNRSNGRGKPGDGRRLTIGGRAFPTGLGVHAPSDVRFTVPAGCTRFTATVGIDDEVGNRGSAVFQVYSGSTKRYDSGLLRGAGSGVPVSVPVQPGSALRLVVAAGPDGPRFDRGDWAAARLVCSSGRPAVAKPTAARPAPAVPATRGTPSAATAPAGGPVGAPGSWQRAFSDEFDGSRLDGAKWSDHDAWQTKGYADHSAWYPVPHTGRQITVADGVLTLRSRRSAGLPGGKAFTSAHINSKGKYSIPAGATSFTEARIKAPSAAGSWPGFWLLGNGTSGDGGGWPITGEVDILEFANNRNEKGAPYFSVWYPKDVHTRAPGTFLNGTHDTHPGSSVKRPELLNSWHTWGLMRSPDRMDLYIDGRLISTFRPGQAYGNKIPLPPMLFRNAQHLRLSLLVGGWAGHGLSEAEYQDADFAVDYVRVWTG